MIKKILLVIAAVIVLAVLVEIVALVREAKSVAGYANYWKQQNKTAQGTLTYVALGDSTAQGIGASKATNSYVGILAGRIAKQTGLTVKVINLSVSGAKINDVLTKQLPQLAQYTPDLVTVEIGANDIAGYNSERFKAEFSELAAKLPTGTYVSDMPYFGGRIRANTQALDASDHIITAVQTNGLRQVYLQKLTKDRQSFKNYAPDLFHPSNHGYTNWADAFWQEIEPHLTQRLAQQPNTVQ